jgi:hypothetical protein
VSIDPIGDVLNVMELIVTLAVSMVVAVKEETKLSDDASVEADSESHPWHGIDFGSDIMNEF